jgi:hypothetical protein
MSRSTARRSALTPGQAVAAPAALVAALRTVVGVAFEAFEML